MDKEKFKEMWEWLQKETLNFMPRSDSYEQVMACIERQVNNYHDKLIVALKSALNIFNNHYLINGNKRVAIGVFNLIKNNDWEYCKDILKALESE